MKATARRKLLVMPLLALVATACGSTAAPQGGTLAGGGAGAPNGLAAPNGSSAPNGVGSANGGLVGGGGLGTGPGSSVAGGTGAVGTQVGSTGTGTAGSGGASGTSGVSGTTGAGGSTGTQAAPGGKVPGIENGFIKIGVVRVKNAGAAYAAIGASALAGSGYGERMVEALVKDINRKGIKGLKVKIVYYDFDQNDPSVSSEVTQQRECAAWTQDDRVFAAMAGEGPVLDACLAKAGVLEICGNCSISTYDDKQTRATPLLFSPNGVTVDRQVDFYVKGLMDGGYFTGAPDNPKVGFLTYDDPVRKRQTPRLEADLKRRTGLTFAAQGVLPQPGGGDGDARFLNAIQSYMLQFKAKGVNRVLVLDNSGQTAAYAMQAADKNQYFPRWGFNSTSGPGILYSAGVVPDSQLPGMTVVGWQPASDVGIKSGTQLPPGLTPCVELFKKAGMNMASDTDYLQAGSNCDGFFFLRDALMAASATSISQFGAGAASLGAAFRSSVVYGADQGQGRRYAGDIYRVGAFDSTCKCFTYVGAQHRM